MWFLWSITGRIPTRQPIIVQIVTTMPLRGYHWWNWLSWSATLCLLDINPVITFSGAWRSVEALIASLPWRQHSAKSDFWVSSSYLWIRSRYIVQGREKSLMNHVKACILPSLNGTEPRYWWRWPPGIQLRGTEIHLPYISNTICE